MKTKTLVLYLTTSLVIVIMKSLTRAEEEIMQVLWGLEKGFVKDIIEQMPDPKPAYNTVSTIVRILEKKGVVNHKAFGKTHEYYPLISKEEYSQKHFKNFVKRYFGNSYKQLVALFAQDENLTLKDINEMIQILERVKQRKKGNKSMNIYT